MHGDEAMPVVVEALKDIHARQRKLMRTKHSRVSHFLSLAKALPATRRGLQTGIAKRQTDNKELVRSTIDTKELLAQAETQMRLLRATLAELQEQNTAAGHAMELIKTRARTDIASFRQRYSSATAGVLALAEKDLQELRTYNKPPVVIEAVLAAVCVILGFPSDWDSALMLMNHATVPLFTRVAQFDLATLRQPCCAQLARLTTLRELEPLRVRTVSAAAYNLVLWVHAVQEHAQVDGINRWERSKVQDVLEKQNVIQVRAA
jgi:hypothetical protein